MVSQFVLNKPKKMKILLASISALIAVSLLVCIFWLFSAQGKDYRQIYKEQYDTVLLSTFPVSTYDTEPFSHYRGMTLLKTEHIIPDYSTLKKYMRHIAKSGNTISTIYLGIRPDRISIDELCSLLEEYPSVRFELIASYPSINYWTSLEPSEYEQILDLYCLLIEQAPNLPSNGSLYFYSSQEWMVCNPGNYENDWLAAADCALFITTHSDYLHNYMITSENAETSAQAFRVLLNQKRSEPPHYPNLDHTTVIFFGDSIIANYTDATSIPGITKALTGAVVYNCGLGGGTASIFDEYSTSLPGILDAYFAGNPSTLPQDTQVYKGIVSCLSDSSSDRNQCFVINYGLNDYFWQCPINSADPYDVDSYAGAIRTAVSKIREHCNNAQIILCTPTFTTYYQGKANSPVTEPGKRLEDYADAVIKLAEELNVSLLDNYHSLGMNAQNQQEYLDDFVHPNEICRYRIAQSLIELIRPQ